MTRTLLLITTAAAALAAAPALAQSSTAPPTSPDAQAGMPEDVIVTAQKREETLIDVPQSVSVISGATLERQQAVLFQDYVKLVPGLQLEQSNAGEARLVLRGINTGGVASTVSTYLDETPFGSSSGQNNGAILAGEFDTFDVARIEVLRGPQGTLYGASSLGGVVKFVTNAPRTDKFEGRVRGNVEFTDDGETSYMGQGVLNVPVSDTLAVRGSGFYRFYGGYIDSIGTAGSDREKNINDAKSYGGRGSLLFTPTSDLSIRLSALAQDFRNNASSLVEVDPEDLEIRYAQLSRSQYVPAFNNTIYRLYNGTVDYDFGFAELLSSTSYAIQNVRLRGDLTASYGPALGVTDDIGLNQRTNLRKWTQEVRVQSPAERGVFDWLLGGYYTHERGGIFQRLDAFTPGTFTVDTALPQLADIFTTSKYEEYAGFANATLRFGRFELGGGGRYSHNDQFADQGGTGLLAPPALQSRSKENVWTWSGSAKYKFSDNASLYVRVAKGFRPGGPNLLPPGVPAGTPVSYRSDSLISYEAGVKLQTADRTFAFDAAGFHIDWDDVQLFTVVNGFGVNANGGRAQSDGVEFTATARPTPGFVVSANGAYTDARLATDTDPALGGFKGDQLPFTPRVSASVNADYTWRIGGYETFVGASLRSLSKQRANFDAGFTALYGLDRRTIPAYEVVDLRAGVDFGRFSLEAYARNVGDSHGITSVSTGGGLPVAPNGAIAAGVIRPRTVGVTLGAGF